MTNEKPKSAQRLAFIDVMRGLVALWMIETHAVNELGLTKKRLVHWKLSPFQKRRPVNYGQGAFKLM